MAAADGRARVRVIGKGSLIRETVELDSPKVVQLKPGTFLDGFETAQSSTGIPRTRVATVDGAHAGWVSAKTVEAVADDGAAAAAAGADSSFWSTWKGKVGGDAAAPAAAPALTPEEKRAAKEAAATKARKEAYAAKVAERERAKKALAAAPATKAQRGAREALAAERKAAGNSCFGRSAYGEAIKHYDAALALLTEDSPDLGATCANRSACAAARGERADAVAFARRAVAARPDWPKAHFRLGKALAVDDFDLNGAANALDGACAGLRAANGRTPAAAAELAAVERALADVEARLDASLGEAPVKTECGLRGGFAAGKRLGTKVRKQVSVTCASSPAADIEDTWLDVDARRKVAPRAKKRKPGFEVGVYRPPSEAHSLMVRVTRGCQWNRCTYCKMYRGIEYALRHVDDVLLDIKAMGEIYDLLERSRYSPEALAHLVRCGYEEAHVNAVGAIMQLEGGLTSAFLQDADAMFASADDLVAIVSRLRATFPTLERVTTYARSDSISEKTPEELGRIRAAGLDRLHVGLETGSLAVTRLCRKGVLPKHQLGAGIKAMAAGFEYSVYVMPGLGGRALSADHVRATAALVSRVNPSFVRFRTYCPIPGTEGYDALVNEDFEQLSETEHVQEMRDMVAALGGDCGSTVTSADHLGNLVAAEGSLPAGRAALLEVYDFYLAWPANVQERFALGRRLGLASGDPREFKDSQELAGFHGLIDHKFGSVKNCWRHYLAKCDGG